MKLGRTFLAAVGLSACAAACAGAPCSRVVESPSAVGTTSLMTAEIPSAEEAPRVGKSQRASGAEGEAHGARERGSRRPGGGFSGYK